MVPVKVLEDVGCDNEWLLVGLMEALRVDVGVREGVSVSVAERPSDGDKLGVPGDTDSVVVELQEWVSVAVVDRDVEGLTDAVAVVLADPEPEGLVLGDAGEAEMDVRDHEADGLVGLLLQVLVGLDDADREKDRDAERGLADALSVAVPLTDDVLVMLRDAVRDAEGVCVGLNETDWDALTESLGGVADGVRVGRLADQVPVADRDTVSLPVTLGEGPVKEREPLPVSLVDAVALALAEEAVGALGLGLRALPLREAVPEQERDTLLDALIVQEWAAVRVGVAVGNSDTLKLPDGEGLLESDWLCVRVWTLVMEMLSLGLPLLEPEGEADGERVADPVTVQEPGLSTGLRLMVRLGDGDTLRLTVLLAVQLGLVLALQDTVGSDGVYEALPGDCDCDAEAVLERVSDAVSEKVAELTDRETKLLLQVDVGNTVGLVDLVGLRLLVPGDLEGDEVMVVLGVAVTQGVGLLVTLGVGEVERLTEGEGRDSDWLPEAGDTERVQVVTEREPERPEPLWVRLSEGLVVPETDDDGVDDGDAEADGRLRLGEGVGDWLLLGDPLRLFVEVEEKEGEGAEPL
mmetsp:Transcript_24665/g.44794  ORF Transcript_24665/g.44794 Transcript_24665/m.44794 type:complete len:577 (+) Transcript_24665:1759-3489(+)